MNGSDPQNQIILQVTPQQALSTLLSQGATPGPIGSGDNSGPPAITRDSCSLVGATRHYWGPLGTTRAN